MTVPEVVAIATALVAIAVPTVGWVRERGRDKAITRRAEVGVELDIANLAKAMLEEQRAVHAQEVNYYKQRWADCEEGRRNHDIAHHAAAG